MKKRNRFPKGWNEDRVQGVLEHYESQTEEEAVAEDEAAFRKRDYTIMVVSESTRTQNHKAGGAEKTVGSRERHTRVSDRRAG
jgi:hypothetical protein